MRHLLPAFVLLAAGAAPASARDGNIIQTAARAGKFRTLLSALVATGLDEPLRSGTFTVFAPDDDAFAKLPAGTLESLLKPEGRDKLAAILKLHVVADAITGDSFNGKSVRTLSGESVELNADGHRATVGKANVRFNSGKMAIPCSNGQIIVIDRVLLPEAAKEPKAGNLLSVARSVGKFNTLLKAVEAAGLTEALDGEGPFTVFAPTDEAFAKLPEGTLAKLLKPGAKDDLAAILKLHVVKGRVGSSELAGAGQAKTLAGERVRVDIKDGRLTIKNAKVLTNDVAAQNGTIHVIDRVLAP
jgi:uncharacterized surface protein with fasciclin (FAS1) repeats